MENQLIKVVATPKGNQVVSARELHNFLEVGKDFSNWIKDQLATFEENVEYAKEYFAKNGDKIQLAKKGESDIQEVRIHRIEYILTIDTAKQIAMLQRNDKGKEARLYFIEVEKKYREQTQPKALTQAEMFLQIAQQNVETERRQLALEASQKEIEAKQHELAIKFKEFKDELDANAKEIELSPESTVELADKTMRSTLSSFVNAVSKAKGIPFNNVWNNIYAEFKTRYHINVQLRANNAGVSKIQWCDDNHYIDVVYGIAKQLYGNKQ